MIAADKLAHMKVGVLVTLVSGLAWFLMALAGLTTIGTMGPAVGMSGLVAGITKEGADWLDNRAARAAGSLIPVHGVEVMDAVATAAPGLVLWAILLATKNFGL